MPPPIGLRAKHPIPALHSDRRLELAPSCRGEPDAVQRRSPRRSGVRPPRNPLLLQLLQPFWASRASKFHLTASSAACAAIRSISICRAASSGRTRFDSASGFSDPRAATRLATSVLNSPICERRNSRSSNCFRFPQTLLCQIPEADKPRFALRLTKLKLAYSEICLFDSPFQPAYFRLQACGLSRERSHPRQIVSRGHYRGDIGVSSAQPVRRRGHQDGNAISPVQACLLRGPIVPCLHGRPR